MTKDTRPRRIRTFAPCHPEPSLPLSGSRPGVESHVSRHPAVRAALAVSFLSELPADAIEGIWTGALLRPYPAGSMVYRADDPPCGGLVVKGLLRARVTSPEGRQAALWYVHMGDAFGITTLFGVPGPFDLEALTDCLLLRFDVRSLAGQARTDGRVAWAIAAEVARRLARTSDELACATFGTVRQRVARHLLVLAGAPQRDRARARVSQQTIANSLGTAREVVARSIGQLRAGGLVQTGRAGIEVRDPERLRMEAAEVLPQA
jgi:CRP/FNR family transcriptional regulator, cyclic AMP receptor protein